jgi:MFS family permease
LHVIKTNDDISTSGIDPEFNEMKTIDDISTSGIAPQFNVMKTIDDISTSGINQEFNVMKTIDDISTSGIDPKPGDSWSCQSEKCLKLTSANASLLEEFPCDLTEEVSGKKELLFGPSDIVWHLDHTSFSVDFDLYCNVGSRQAKKTLLSSMYFPGALTGLMIGGYLFDNVGRKKTAMVAVICSFLVHLSGLLCNNFSFLLAIRFFQGLTNMLCGTGMFILQLELMPANYRNLINGFAGIAWSLGYPIAAAVGYLVYSWKHMYLASAIISLIFRLHIFVFIIESPRFFLINNDKESAKRSFEALAALTRVKLDLEKTEIVDASKTKEREQTLKKQFKELRKYPSVLKEILLVMILWFFIAMFFYGFNFGWGKILPNKYLAYLMAGVGEVLAATLSVPLIHRVGRRRALMICHIGASLVFLIAIPEVELVKGWTLESVCCLVGVTFVSGCFTIIYLWTGEVAPTSHRGFTYAAGSGAARVGSFIGPYIFNNLAPSTHRAVPFVGLSVASFVCALVAFLLVETGDKEIACVAADVEARRKGYRYRI